MASVAPGAIAAPCRSVPATAQAVRYMLTPVDATTAGRLASKPAATGRCHVRPWLRKRVEARAEDDVLAHAIARLVHDEVVDEPRASPTARSSIRLRSCSIGASVQRSSECPEK